MGSEDLLTATSLDSGLASRSYEPMDYTTTYNIRYQEDFNISNTRPNYGGKKLQSSMLAYTNYVVERQNRQQHFPQGNLGRRHTIEIGEDIHSRQISNSTKFPGISLPFTKIPVLNKIKSRGVPRLSEKYNRVKDEQGILRGHTFPPLDGNQKSRRGRPSVTISVATVSDLYDVTDRTRCEAKVSEVINHDKLHAWLATDQPPPEPDLSNILTTSKTALTKKSKELFAAGNVINSDESSDNNLSDRQIDNMTSLSHNTFKDEEYTDRAKSDDQPTQFAKKKHSEELLRSAIKTLKLMEKELEELPHQEATQTKEKAKKKKSQKKVKRLKLPEQTLDIIPELECENLYAPSPDVGYSSEVSPACVHYSKRSKVDSVNHGSDDAIDDGIDYDIGDVEDGFHTDTYYEEETLDLCDFKGIKGKSIGPPTLALPPIGKPHRVAVTLSQGQVDFSVSKQDKVKSEIRNKIKRKHKH